MKNNYGRAPLNVLEMLAKHGSCSVEMLKILLWKWNETAGPEGKRRNLNKVLSRLLAEDFIKMTDKIGHDRWFVLTKKGAEQLNFIDPQEYDYARDGLNLITPWRNKLQKLLYCCWCREKEKKGYVVYGNHMLRSTGYDGWNFRQIDAVAQKVLENQDVETILCAVRSDFSATGLKSLETISFQCNRLEIVCVDSAAKRFAAAIKENFVLSRKARCVTASMDLLKQSING